MIASKETWSLEPEILSHEPGAQCRPWFLVCLFTLEQRLFCPARLQANPVSPKPQEPISPMRLGFQGSGGGGCGVDFEKAASVYSVYMSLLHEYVIRM